MSQSREHPPTEWAELGPQIETIDAEVGIYLGPTFRKDTTNPTFWHWCVFSETRKIQPRWLAMGTPAHTVHSRAPWHLEASLLCHECGLHGWIRDGRWVPA